MEFENFFGKRMLSDPIMNRYYIIINKHTRHSEDANQGFKIRIICMKQSVTALSSKGKTLTLNKCH